MRTGETTSLEIDCGSFRVRGVSCYCLLVAVQKIPASAGIMSLHRRKILCGARVLIVLISCWRSPNAAALPAERALHSHSTCIASLPSDPHHLHKGDSTKRRLNMCLSRALASQRFNFWKSVFHSGWRREPREALACLPDLALSHLRLCCPSTQSAEIS